MPTNLDLKNVPRNEIPTVFEEIKKNWSVGGEYTTAVLIYLIEEFQALSSTGEYLSLLIQKLSQDQNILPFFQDLQAFVTAHQLKEANLGINPMLWVRNRQIGKKNKRIDLDKETLKIMQKSFKQTFDVLKGGLKASGTIEEALKKSVDHGLTHWVDYFIQIGGKVEFIGVGYNFSYLHTTVSNRDAATTRILIKHGVKTGTHATYVGRSKYTKARLIGSPLDWAAAVGDVDVIKALIEGGADPNEYSRTGELPLYIAARYGNIKAVNFFLELNPFRLSSPASNGNTIFHVAAETGQTAVIQALLDFSSRTGTKIFWDDNNSPLLTAAIHNQLDVVKLFLQLGFNPNARDRKGKSFLEVADSALTVDKVFSDLELLNYIKIAIKEYLSLTGKGNFLTTFIINSDNLSNAIKIIRNDIITINPPDPTLLNSLNKQLGFLLSAYAHATSDPKSKLELIINHIIFIIQKREIPEATTRVNAVIKDYSHEKSFRFDIKAAETNCSYEPVKLIIRSKIANERFQLFVEKLDKLNIKYEIATSDAQKESGIEEYHIASDEKNICQLRDVFQIMTIPTAPLSTPLALQLKP